MVFVAIRDLARLLNVSATAILINQLIQGIGDPLAGHTLPFIVVIANAQVFLKVFPGVRQIVLGLGRQPGNSLPNPGLNFV